MGYHQRAKLSGSHPFDSLHSSLSLKLWSLCNQCDNIPPGMIQLAFSARLSFILQCDRHSFDCNSIVFGAADVDDDMKDQSKELDPWLKTDPWSVKRNCKWEDLKLPSDHPICDAKNVRLSQHHRHQLSSNLGGVAFVTKAMIPEVIAQHPKKPFALLLPVSDKLAIDPSYQLTTTGPHEVIVGDSSTGATYKRQVRINLLTLQNSLR